MENANFAQLQHQFFVLMFKCFPNKLILTFTLEAFASPITYFVETDCRYLLELHRTVHRGRDSGGYPHC